MLSITYYICIYTYILLVLSKRNKVWPFWRLKGMQMSVVVVFFLNILIYYLKDVGRKVLREVGKREARDRNRQLMSVTRAILQALTYSYYFCPNVSPWFAFDRFVPKPSQDNNWSIYFHLFHSHRRGMEIGSPQMYGFSTFVSHFFPPFWNWAIDNSSSENVL